MSDSDSFPYSKGAMQHALKLARRGLGKASPNPMVGAVVVKDNHIVGEGYHVYSRRHHAEVIALQKAGELAQGADLYVTLEPCSHTGRTPPCINEIIKARVERVYVAIRDPSPAVNGKGVQLLKKAGVKVFEGLCEEKAFSLNEDYFHRVQTGKPFTTLKLALSLDGKIATRTGRSKWLTGEKAQSLVHRIRFRHDAILVGSKTVCQDNPALDVRSFRSNQIVKVVLDSELRVEPNARLFWSQDPVLIFHSCRSSLRNFPNPKACELIKVGRGTGGLDWKDILNELGKRCINSLLIEGGGEVAASLLGSNFLQRMLLFYAPKIIGEEGVSGFGSLGVSGLSEAYQVSFSKIQRVGDDFLVEVRF